MIEMSFLVVLGWIFGFGLVMVKMIGFLVMLCRLLVESRFGVLMLRKMLVLCRIFEIELFLWLGFVFLVNYFLV